MHRYITYRPFFAARNGVGKFAERQDGLVATVASRNSSDYNGGRRTRSVNQSRMLITAAAAGATGYYLWKKYSDANYSLKNSAYSVAQSLFPAVSAEEPKATETASSADGGNQTPKPALPSHVPYLIIGSGTAAFTAYKAIRAVDAKAKVLMVGEEQHVPYMRPPLSKEMWFTEDRKLVDELKVKMWGGKERSIFYEKDTFFCAPHELSTKETGGVALLRGHKVVKLDVSAQLAVLDDGTTVKYDKCLIATGGKPKSLPIFQTAGPEVQQRTTLFRNIEDFKQLDSVVQSAGSVAIIGGSFMGSELAVGLATRGKNTSLKVIQLFPENGNMGRTLPPYLSNWTTDRVRAIGVEIRPKTSVKAVNFDEDSKKVALTLDNGQTLKVDHVILSVGIEPATELAAPSGLEVDPKFGGFLVNAELEARRNIWVAGDVASFYDVKLGRRRVEHHDHAIVSGRLAGENMTGGGKSYWHQSMFWSDLGPEVGYEAIGIIDSSLQTFAAYREASAEDTPQAASNDAELRSETEEKKGHKELSVEKVSKPDDGSKNYGKGVIFYLRDGYIVGVVMWNIFGKMSIARKLINEDQKFEDFTDVARLFFQPDEAKS